MVPLLAVWIALGALLTTLVTVFTDWGGKEGVVTLLPYTYALACTLAAASLWRLRQRSAEEPGISGQRLQAVVAILICALALTVLLIAANGIVYGLAGLAIEIGFLVLCYFGYTRLVVEK